MPGNTEVILADSFYQNAFELNEGAVGLGRVSEEGKIDGGFIDAMDEDGNMIKVPVSLIPASYAGTHDQYDPCNGEQYLMGIPVGNDLVNTLGNNRQQVKEFLTSVHDSH